MLDAMNVPRGRRAVGVTPDPMPAEAPVDRVTMTGPALREAHTMIVTLTGANQTPAVLEKALDDGVGSTVPIGRVLAEVEVPVDIYWSAA